jgi:hypothetical protein
MEESEAVEAEAMVERQPHGLAIPSSSSQYPSQRPCMLLQESHFEPELFLTGVLIFRVCVVCFDTAVCLP